LENSYKSSIELMTSKALNRKHSEDTKLKMSSVRGKSVEIYENVSSEGFKLIDYLFQLG
jgi:hypothetical protein